MKNKILVYDDNCLLCTWYSGLFVKYGLLPEDGRKPFSTLDSSLSGIIDFDKSKNEIPLFDKQTGNVLYGVNALLEILGEKAPLIKKFGNLSAVKWLLTRFYKLISFNRKVIVAKKCGPGLLDCSPDINYFYRFLFMALCLVFNTLMLFPVHETVFARLSYYEISVNYLQAGHFVLVSTNCTLALLFKKEKATEYLGQVNMLALLVILLLTPLLTLTSIFSFNEIVITIYLIITAIIIFKEYLRRMEYAGVLNNNKWVVSVNLAGITGFILFLFN